LITYRIINLVNLAMGHELMSNAQAINTSDYANNNGSD